MLVQCGSSYRRRISCLLHADLRFYQEPYKIEIEKYGWNFRMDPKVLHQMGGMEGLEKMMTQFQDHSSGKKRTKAGLAPDFSMLQ